MTCGTSGVRFDRPLSGRRNAALRGRVLLRLSARNNDTVVGHEMMRTKMPERVVAMPQQLAVGYREHTFIGKVQFIHPVMTPGLERSRPTPGSA